MSVREERDFLLEDDPLWYKSAIIYEAHVRAFCDANADGIGDFRGLTRKLDYLQDLGVTALWLLPFYPSPLKDDGYDIADYHQIHPSYGTLADFKRFLREAHRRGLRVITELVINHTSDQHPWFQRARRARPDSRERNFYVWSDTRDKYGDARIIFKDFESSNWTWDSVAGAYYWHRFYSHQPDLNFENPAVIRAVFRVLDFWLKMGVDGLRLDAVPYLFEEEGTNCENLPQTHALLKRLRAHVDRHFRHRMLLAEANQWPEDAVHYFGDGDESHMNFHFPLMPRLFMAIRLEDRFPILDILEQTPPIPETCQWALFLRNHDELTLEMVTEEERDYMYRVYAGDRQARINLGIRRRLAPLLGNNRRKIELMNGLLFSLPGSPVLYYGDEIGMGDNIYLGDRNGVRTPMQWSPDRNAGFSQANPQRLYLPVIIDPEYHYESVNVETQLNNPSSLLWWMRRLIALRKRFQAFGHGKLEFLHPENHKVLAFLRSYQEEEILVVANLSRFTQCVELELSQYRGFVPVELFGQTRFPSIGELPYFLTLGPHSFYWFALEKRGPGAESLTTRPAAEALPSVLVTSNWTEIFKGAPLSRFEQRISQSLAGRRWFGAKRREIRSCRIAEQISIPFARSEARLVFLQVAYTDGDPESYLLPLACASPQRSQELLEAFPAHLIARLQRKDRDERGYLYDPLIESDFCQALLKAILQRSRFAGSGGELQGSTLRNLKAAPPPDPGQIHLLGSEQSNTSVVYGTQWILKLFRRLEPGLNPDLEIGRFLTLHKFPHVPAVAGALEYRREAEQPVSVAILQEYVANEGDAWTYTLDALDRYYERVVSAGIRLDPRSLPRAPDVCSDREVHLSPAAEVLGIYPESARLLGQRTAELHLCLASDPEDPDFAPEPYTYLAQRSLYQSMRTLMERVFRLLRANLRSLPQELQEDARAVLDLRREILAGFRQILEQRITARRIRCHGDYHLGQVLYTGKDFLIIDFEGEPARPISERRLKRSSLRDVAGMLRSFHYAAHTSLSRQAERGLIRREEIGKYEPWARFWYEWVSACFLGAYLSAAGESDILPDSRPQLRSLLHAFLLEKSIYELAYELNNRPDWLHIPLHGILELLRSDEAE